MTSLSAQVVSVRVTDTDGRQPILGALVSLERDGKTRVAQSLSDAGGRVVLRGTGTATYRVRADRIGYEGLFSASFQLGLGDSVSLSLQMPNTRVLLPDIIVTSNRVCTLDRERGTALAALWGEAEKALAGTVVTSRTLPHLDVTTFERDLDRRERVVKEQSATTRRSTVRPFVAADPAVLMERGFVRLEGTEAIYAAPDAELLLSDQFLATHCFGVIGPSKGDTTLVGLTFEPTPGRTVPDVKGTLWLDRRSSQLRFLEFDYRNLDRDRSVGREGGRIEFQQLPSGGWIISNWVIRMPRLGRIRARSATGHYEQRDSLIGTRETGGRAELVVAGGPPPTRAVLAGIVFDSVSGSPLAGATVSIAGGSYQAATDSGGRFRIETPIGGDFLITVDHPRIRLLTDRPVVGSARLERGQVTTVTLALPPLARLEPDLCGGDRSDPAKSAIVVGRLTDSSGVAIPFGTVSLRWLASVRATESAVGVVISQRAASAAVTSDRLGVFRICGIPRDARVWVNAAGGFVPVLTSVLVGAERLAVRDLVLRPRAGLATGAVVRVRVVDQIGRAPVAGALVTLAPSTDSVRTDPSGSAVFEALHEGSHLLDVRALGFDPTAEEIGVTPRDTTEVTIVLTRTAFLLAPLEVAGATTTVHPMMAGFEERRKDGLGHYFTLQQLKAREHSALSDVLRMSPGLQLVPLRHPCRGYAAATGRSRGGGRPPLCQGTRLENACFLAVFVDGMNTWNARHSEPPPDLDQFRVNDIEAVEVYVGPAQLPAQYHITGADCGAVLIWQRVSGPR